MFLKKGNISSKIKRSKVTDYPALMYIKEIAASGLLVIINCLYRTTDLKIGSQICNQCPNATHKLCAKMHIFVGRNVIRDAL